MVTRLNEVITLQCMQILSHHVVYLKLIYCYMIIIPQLFKLKQFLKTKIKALPHVTQQKRKIKLDVLMYVFIVPWVFPP